ncbi:MAG: hydroxymethylglutaryl-CoA reductase [Thermoplasmatota archaeon]
MKIPSSILTHLYTFGSLVNTKHGVRFSMKNKLSDATLTGINRIEINGKRMDLEKVRMKIQIQWMTASEITENTPAAFHIGQRVDVHLPMKRLEKDMEHAITLSFKAKGFGQLVFNVKDRVKSAKDEGASIPYDKENDYEPKIIEQRKEFIEEFSGKKLDHLIKYSFDPKSTRGNIENFTGAAQVPIGFAGPIKVNGEHAKGEFLVPLATSEGTLVASYNRGIKVINLSGGANVTVVDERMQRAPVFIFDSAREAREFGKWVDRHFQGIKESAEATSKVARLDSIDKFLASKFVYLRFNFHTGDAAGQNMVGKATFAACSWIMENFEDIRNFYLESNFATDKKGSQVNILHTRGKRVTAEVTVKRDVLLKHLRVDPDSLLAHNQVANIGAFMSGANNNGLHAANSITAMFIACGQDVANVAESSAGILYAELTEEGDMYISLTLPSLIVATYGGGTGLATQRECLEVMDCYGKGRVKRFAEIVTAVALAGEISLAAAISSLEWVPSHDRLGRNR